MFDGPRMVDAEPIRELDLIEGVLEQLELTAFVPRPRELVLVEDAESHVSPSRPLSPLDVGRASLPERALRGNTSAVEPDFLHAAPVDLMGHEVPDGGSRAGKEGVKRQFASAMIPA